VSGAGSSGGTAPATAIFKKSRRDALVIAVLPGVPPDSPGWDASIGRGYCFSLSGRKALDTTAPRPRLRRQSRRIIGDLSLPKTPEAAILFASPPGIREMRVTMSCRRTGASMKQQFKSSRSASRAIANDHGRTQNQQ